MKERIAFVAVAIAACTSIVAEGQPAPRMPGPARAGYVRGTRAEDDAACVKCHRAEARDHEGSLHRASFDDASFQRGYLVEPKAFCRSCHAPESEPSREPDAFARSHGVTCVTCHKPDPAGPVLSSPSAKPSRAPHATARIADFGTRACASCHEFAFPGGEALGDEGRMQKTMSEHAASSARDRSCADCHMPKDETGRSGHRFAASRDPALLARSVTVDVARTPEGFLAFTVRARDVGHAFPTGDLFRRLVLRVHGPRGVIERPLERTFSARKNEHGRVVRFETSDRRPAPEQRVLVPTVAAPGTRYELVYQRLTGVGQTPPFAVTVEDEIELARGTL